ncbi:type II toxin-antitoxin system RelE/ParE family toxin [Flavobacterium sp.]|uniref:type II toxin-antitoxin system RelE/ParE family toxin n=1 Tax=Flavobacterium sp. TaxID=239 RepID=UPI000ED7C690|nr:type II toxin-antitoxin system RelE/ParE family toxin [Flavobacterium sp.]HCQ13983.1 addiction module toxin RelE [Flavobacterium sp.]
MKPIQFTKEAVFDIEEIVFWYEDQREGLSYDFELSLEAGINEIQRTPSAFQKRYKEVKIRFINRFPCGIHYIVKDEIITIIAVFHTSRSPSNWVKRNKS